MIQRIQSFYLFLAAAFLFYGTLTDKWFALYNDTTLANFHSGGVDISKINDHTLIEHTTYPFYIYTILLLVLTLATLFSFKKLAIQQKIGRLNLVLYLFFVIGLSVWSFLGENILDGAYPERSFGFGYYSLILGFPFVFMANLGIKRDKQLIDSLNRIR